MKKHMLEENLMKISELADRMVTDPAIASMLSAVPGRAAGRGGAAV